MAQKGNITCNAIFPGYVHTDLIRNKLEDTAKARGISKVCIQPADSKCCKECSLHYLPPFVTRKRVLHQLKCH